MKRSPNRMASCALAECYVMGGFFQVRRVTIDPDSLASLIEYALPVAGQNPAGVALLPGFEPGFKP